MAKDSQEGASATPPEDLPEDLEDLARRYVDLWQDQMTALASDPEFAESLQKVMAAMGVAASGLPAMWSAWPAAMTSLMAAAQPGMSNPQGQETHGQPAGGKQNGSGAPAAARSAEPPATEAGAASAAAASPGGGADLGELEKRLAALEQRLRSLEGSLDGGTGRARGRAKGKAKRS